MVEKVMTVQAHFTLEGEGPKGSKRIVIDVKVYTDSYMVYG
jgi:hypothetical protein